MLKQLHNKCKEKYFLFPWLGWCLLCYGLVSFSNNAQAERSFYTNMILAGSYNSLGVLAQINLGPEWELHSHNHFALSENFLRLEGEFEVTPLSLALGMYLRVQPTSFLRFWAYYKHRFYLPAFTSNAYFRNMQEVHNLFSSRTTSFDGDDKMKAHILQSEETNQQRIVYGTHILGVGGLLQLQVGPLVAMAQTQILSNQAYFPAGTTPTILYDPIYDVFARMQDVIVDTLAIAGYEWRNWMFVIAVAHTKALSTSSEVLLIGPAVRWVITKKWKYLKTPTLLMTCRWFVRHRWRNTAFPNVAFQLESQFDWFRKGLE